MTTTPSNDPLTEAAQALSALLNGPTLQEVTAKLRETMERAAQVDSPARPIIIGQLNVMTVVNTWLAALSVYPDSAIPVTDAVEAILTAVESGMAGEQL